jgi:hypothetical protein
LAATVVLGVIACCWLAPVLIGQQLGQSYVQVSDPPFKFGAPSLGSLPQRAVFPDAGMAFHPWRVVAHEQVAEGHLPLWNPYEYGGTVLLGNMQSALAFPLTWLTFAIPADVAAGLLAIAKLLLAGLGAFALAREIGVRRWGAGVVAGTVYMVSAPMTVWLQWPNATAFALYPWLLAATHRAWSRPGRRSVAVVGAAVTLTLLAGHPESALAAFSGAGVFLVVLLAFRARAAPSIGGLWLLGALLGAAGAAVVVLPFLDALGASVTKTTHTIGLNELPFYTGLQFLAPHLFGDGQPHVYGFIFYTGIAGYFGIPALMLALVALWRHRVAPATAALTATALVALMTTFGLPPVSVWTSHVAPWSTALLAGRVYFIVALAAAIGAGAGYSALSERPLPVRRVVLVAGGVAAVLLVGVALAERRDLLVAPASVKWTALILAGVAIAAGAGLLAGLGRGPASLMLLATIVVCAVSLLEQRGLNVTLAPEDAYPRAPAAIRFLQRQRWPFRVQVIRPRESMVPPNLLAQFGLESLEGYDFPLSSRWSDTQGAALRYAGLLPERRVLIGPPQEPALTALRLFNVRYYLAEPGAAPPAPGFETAYSGPDATVFRDPAALPRAFVVPSVRPLSDDDARGALSAADFDPRKTALVPRGTESPAGPVEKLVPARVERLAPDHLRVHLPAGAAGWLVIGNAYSSSWEASVDGRSEQLRPTDFSAMGLPVAAGARTVDVRLDRTRYWIGALISLLAILTMVLLALLGRGAARPGPRPPAPPATAPPSA